MRNTRYWEDKAIEIAKSYGANIHRRHCSGMGYAAVLERGIWNKSRGKVLISSDIMSLIDDMRAGVSK